MRRIAPGLIVLALLGLFSLPVSAQQCPCSIWGTSVTPATIDGGDPSAVELGVKFRSDVAGYVSGVRFYKSAANTGAHVGNLWDSAGNLLASATFVGESGSGWQQVYFSAPVAISASTTYVASYHTTSGHYSFGASFFGTAVDNPPLHALADGADGPNGVYSYGASAFPTSTYNASNYWVDVIFDVTNAPNVSSFSPTGTAVSASTSASATFTSAMDASTITGSTFQLVDSSSLLVNATVSYNASTQTAVLQPAAVLAYNTSYTATVTGGPTGVKDASGNAMASNLTWTFTTAGPPPPPPICPCSLWTYSTMPGMVDSGDANGGEFGLAFKADVAGTITGARFYKSPANVGVHKANLWSSTGQLLATATFANETTSGWQQVNFSSPVAISAGTTYVASYYTPSGHYSYSPGYFNSGFDNGPLHAIPNPAAPNGNGIYYYGSDTFPIFSNNASNYWADVVFVAANSHAQPAITSTTPPTGSTGFGIGTAVSATFNEPLDATTVNSSSFFLTDASNNIVSGTISYASANATISLQPTMELVPFSTYTATVKGTIKDGAGNVMGADYTWSFTTGAPPAGSGPGGPILVIASATNPYSRYYDEIMRAEGLNEFSLQDIAAVTPAMLSSYRVAILGEMQLTSNQVSTLTNWVSGGGSLIAMRPDKQLANVLGLTSTAGTLSDAYLQINTSSGPGVGIVGSTIQYHSTADLYTLSGASKLATLFSSSTTATPYPAVTLNNFGAGKAAAFTYDLAHSVTLTRQGNPAWAGQDRISLAPDRPSDLFFGNAPFDPKPDWNNLANVQIPIADEQQRLLVNMIQQMTFASGPLPRFWFLPSGYKAAIVMTGDDHNQGGTPGRFDIYLADSTPNCSVADWQCVRSTAYIWNGTPITNAQAGAYVAQGFEIAPHIDSDPTCSNWTYQDLDHVYTVLMATFASTWPSVPAPQTHRMHCISWSDYDSQPLVELAHGMRLDTNYYYFPDNFVQDRTGMFNGTGMPMRFVDRNGNTIDVYQATTQLPDEDTWVWPDDINTLLDNALGPLGYYGVFTANMHNDLVASDGSDAIVASAQARGVPIVSSLQMLQWLDGRNSSAFGSMNWSGGVLSFNISVGVGARNLRAMLPVNSSAGSLSNLTLGGQSVAYTTQTIKGVLYAFFVANAGSYQATYGGAPVTYTLTGTISGVGGNSATVTLSGASGGSVTANASGAYTFAGLANGSYTVMPSQAGFVYSPSSRSLTVNGASVSGVNFTSVVQTYSISGTISGSGGNNATVSLSGAGSGSTTSNSSGSFTFTGRANGTYTVTPSKSGFAYTPTSQSVTVNNGNVSGVNFTSIAVAPVVQLTPTSLTFASLAVGSTSASQPVTLKNTGTAALSLSSITIAGTNPGDFAQTNNCPSSLVINATCTVNVTFKPTATGTRSGSLRFTDNAAGSPQAVSLTGSGTGPLASPSPTSITFPVTVNFTTSSAQTVTLRNTGTATLNISSISITGANAADFAIPSNSCGTTLTAGSSCTVNVTFRPSVAGTRTASLTFSDSAFGSPQTVALSGTGTMVTFSPTSLSFSAQTVGTTSAAQTVTLTNVGPATLTISSISFTGTSSADFTQTNTCGTSLASGSSCTISVRFAPRARGTRSATLRITDSDPTSPELVTLSGSGQ